MQKYCRALLPGAHGSREITEHLSADGADPGAGAESSHMREEQSEQGVCSRGSPWDTLIPTAPHKLSSKAQQANPRARQHSSFIITAVFK